MCGRKWAWRLPRLGWLTNWAQNAKSVWVFFSNILMSPFQSQTFPAHKPNSDCQALMGFSKRDTWQHSHVMGLFSQTFYQHWCCLSLWFPSQFSAEEEEHGLMKNVISFDSDFLSCSRDCHAFAIRQNPEGKFGKGSDRTKALHPIWSRSK